MSKLPECSHNQNNGLQVLLAAESEVILSSWDLESHICGDMED